MQAPIPRSLELASGASPRAGGDTRRVSEANLQVVRAHYEAVNRRDLDAVIDGLHPEVEFTAGDERARQELGGPLHGKEEVGRWFRALFAQLSENAVEVAKLEQDDEEDRVVSSVYLHGTWRETGVSGAVPGVHVFTIRDGLIFRNCAYREPAAESDEP